MTSFKLPLKAEGAVTAPSDALVLALPSAEGKTYFDCGESNVLEIPEFGWASADGVNPLKLVTRDAVYDANGIAPGTVPALSTSGARATVAGVYAGGDPGDGQYFIVGIPNFQFAVYFQLALVTDGTLGHQVLIEPGDPDATYANLQALIQGTGTQGDKYFNFLTWKGLRDSFNDDYRIEISALVPGTITFRYVDYGTIGNTCVSVEPVGLDNFAFATTTFTGGVDGTATGMAAGTYRYFYTWYNSETGSETGRSPIAKLTKTTNDTIIVTIPAASVDTDFDFIYVYRTAKKGVEFFPVGSTPRGTLSFTDDVLDVDLELGTAWDDFKQRDYTEGPPPRGRALAFWNEAVWTIGAHKAAEYTRGEVAVTNGSAAVSFVKAGTANALQGVTARMVMRKFQVTGTAEEYRLLSIDESAATGVLERLYEGSTDAHVGFKIVDDYDRTRLQRCVPFKYGQWPVEESPGSVETDDDEGGVALLATTARLYAFSKTSVSACTGDDIESWDMRKIAEGIGAAGPRMVVGVGEGGLLLSPEDGFYALSSNGSFRSVSSPTAQKRQLATGIDDTVARIAWDNVDQGYSYYDKIDRIVVFGLPLDGATTPNYEIVLDLQNGTWTLFKRAEWTACTRIALPGGNPAYLSGDREGRLWHVNVGESDGFYGTEALQTLTAATVRTLTVGGTPFSTSEDGKPVVILYKDGETVDYGKVASSTTSVLTLAEDLDTAPAAGDQIILGGIVWKAKSGFTTGGEEYHKKTLRSVTIRHAPTTRGEYFLSFAVDGGSFALCPVGTSTGDLSQKNGKVRHKTQWPGDTHAIQLRGFKPGGQAILRGGVFDFIVRSHGRA